MEPSWVLRGVRWAGIHGEIQDPIPESWDWGPRSAPLAVPSHIGTLDGHPILGGMDPMEQAMLHSPCMAIEAYPMMAVCHNGVLRPSRCGILRRVLRGQGRCSYSLSGWPD